ncbi:hypothetical protein PHAVU_002G243300 [Phaseolus vulgaris]|uniref:GDSL esterase/lipase n=1 Tax=Phaseolus vulgaris TaxID=3885 RepID=V7CQ60_PHAVU|nr:hypothetical protein PHAVU_002G243300g [Phaseolus vulgaris]ESW31498.1 hypothetical protein PHAVU_002G243300g [Phaseolus vulgaris]
MGCKSKLWLVGVFLLMQDCIGGPNLEVAGFFVFGDSLADCGNNNNLRTEAKVNHLPYGIDFPQGPTGRFTNGRTIVDIIGERLGFKEYIPPFANRSGSDILKGVNYASGSAGILEESGNHLGEHIGLEKQIQNHKIIVYDISKQLQGITKANKHLNECLYYLNIGSNDYVNNYFMPDHYQSSQKFSSDQFAQILTEEYSKHLKVLYILGARKIALSAVGPLGCVPHEVSIHGKPGSLCVEAENDAVTLLNDKLKALVQRFNQQFPDAKFVLIPGLSTDTTAKMAQEYKPDAYVCCKVGPDGQCIPNEKPCESRNKSPYFDAFHPSEVINEAIADNAYSALSTNMVDSSVK